MARGLDRFTDQQRSFLETYLKGGFFNRKSDTGKANSYKAFLDLEAAAQEALDRLAGRSDKTDLIGAALSAARARNDEGKFDTAITEAQRALDLANKEDDILRQRELEKRRLSGVQAGLTAPDDALDAETTDITERKAAITGLLAGDPPSEADIATAREQLRALAEALKTHRAAAKARAEKRDALSAAHTQVTARLTEIDASLKRAKDDSEHATLTSAASTIKTDIDALKAAVEGKDPAAVLTQLGKVAALNTALDQHATNVEAALIRALKAGLSGTGTSDAQQDKLVALGKADPGAMAAAVTALKGFESTLPGTPIDQADLLQRAAQTAAATTQVDTKAAALKTAKDDLDTAYKDAKAALKEKKKRLEVHSDALVAGKAFDKANSAVLKDTSHPDHAAVKVESERYLSEFRAAKALAETAIGDFNAKNAAYKTSKTGVSTAEADLQTAQTALDTKASEEKAAQGKKKLLDAIGFGPLNPDNARALGDPAAEQLVALYAKDPRLADKAVSVASKAKNPESVAIAATAVCNRAGDKFSGGGREFTNASYVEAYAELLIDMSANIPASEAAKLDAYLGSGRQFEAVPGIEIDGSVEKTGKLRVDYVGGALLKSDGTMDFEKGRTAMLDLMFHPDAVDAASSLQVIHMQETLDFLEGSADAQTLLSTTPAPTNDGAKGLLAGMTGKAADAVGKADAQSAIVTAMLTPMYQGKVGSCFTTSGIIKLQQERPLEMMEDLRTIAVEGTFQPKVGDAVPVVQSVSAEENGLLRSFEYTTATATARIADSTERTKLEGALGSAVNYLSDDFKSKRREDVKAALKTAMSDAFDFVYDPTASATGSDGSSTNGSFTLVRKFDGKVITNRTEFADTLETVILATLKKKDTKFMVSRQDVADWTRTDQFLEKIKVGGKLPWELESGGMENQAAQVLEGGSQEIQFMTQGADATTMDMGERSKDVIADMLTRFGDSGDKCVSIGTQGKFNHAFNFLPDHPSLDLFKGDNPADIKAKVQTEMVQKAADAARTALPLDKVNYMFDREMGALAKTARGDAKAALETAWSANRPTVAMTPQDFATHLAAATAAWSEATAKANADAWRGRKVANGDTVSDAEYNAAKAQSKAYTDSERDQDMANRIRDDLALPEVVLADTNWGDPEARNYFTLAPDPLTGVVQMYLKVDPPGKLCELNDAPDWLASTWRTSA